MKRGAFAFALGLGLVTSGRAFARDPIAAAQSEFEQGRKLEAAGDYTGAVAHFEESDRLEPSLGTTLNLAACYEQAGRLASAWRTFLRGSAKAAQIGQERRAMRARELADALRPRLSSLIVDLPADAARDVMVTIDGTVVDATATEPFPLDGGTHRIAALAPGGRDWSTEVTLAPSGDQKTIHIPALVDPPRQADGAAPPTTSQLDVANADASHTRDVAAPAPSTTSTTPAPQTWWTPMRVAGAASAGAGIVGLGVGVAFGLQTRSLWASRQGQCQNNYCTDDGYALGDQARTAATRANIAFAIGGVAIAGGVTLFLLSPRTSTKDVRLGAAALPGGGSFHLAGTFE